MNYSDGIEVHLHDIVKFDYTKNEYDDRGEYAGSYITHDVLGEVIDYFPEYKRCFLIHILGSDDVTCRVSKHCVKLADYRDIME